MMQYAAALHSHYGHISKSLGGTAGALMLSHPHPPPPSPSPPPEAVSLRPTVSCNPGSRQLGGVQLAILDQIWLLYRALKTVSFKRSIVERNPS